MGGAEGSGRIIAESRPPVPVIRLGRLESLWVEVRRRDVHMQWYVWIFGWWIAIFGM